MMSFRFEVTQPLIFRRMQTCKLAEASSDGIAG